LDEPGALLCFSQNGNEKWRFNPGRAVESGKEKFAHLYHVQSIAVKAMGLGRKSGREGIEGIRFGEKERDY
jgi:hypothetical protein